jgi:hypothetical protein
MLTAPVNPAYSAWAAVAYPLALAVLALVQYWILKRTKAAEAHAVATEKKVDQVHVLLDGQKGVLLTALAVSLEAFAAQVHTPQAIEAASVARQNVLAHTKALEVSNALALAKEGNL